MRRETAGLGGAGREEVSESRFEGPSESRESRFGLVRAAAAALRVTGTSESEFGGGSGTVICVVGVLTEKTEPGVGVVGVAAVVDTDKEGVVAVAVGVTAAGHRISLPLTLHAFLHAATSNWISAGVRLIPLGQTDSQRALAALESVIAATAEKSLDASLDDLGSATFRADLASMRHETQYTRLFRS